MQVGDNFKHHQNMVAPYSSTYSFIYSFISDLQQIQFPTKKSITTNPNKKNKKKKEEKKITMKHHKCKPVNVE